MKTKCAMNPQNIQHLVAVTPIEWRKRIDQIANRTLRIQIACIVWWDYFGHRLTSHRWPELDDLIDAWHPSHNVSIKALRDGLIKVGYPRDLAIRRANGGD